MKRCLTMVLALMLLLCVPALGETTQMGDCMIVSGCSSAPLYASYEPDDYSVLCYVPAGESVMYICAVDRGSFVIYGNYAGYIEDGYLLKTQYYSFEMPDGDDDWDDWDDVDYGPCQFPYAALDAELNQKLSARSGPSTDYTEMGTFSEYTPITVFYQTEGNGVNWGYVEYMADGELYRAYTGMKRIDTSEYVPYDPEVVYDVHILCDTCPYCGPGFEYAACRYPIWEDVQLYGMFEQCGWMMVDFQTEGGIQRGWVAPGCWEYD